MKINTNLASLQAVGLMKTVNRKEAETSEKLAASDRIVRAAYDPAGLAISSKMNAHIRSASQAVLNVNNGISFFQIAESALNEGHAIAQRLRELAMQAASDTIDDHSRSIVDFEFQAMKKTVDQIAGSTIYNSAQLLDGTVKSYEIQIGLHNKKDIDQLRYTSDRVNMTTKHLKLGAVNVRSKYSAQAALGSVDKMIQQISEGRVELGSVMRRMGHVIENLQYYKENTSASKSRIRDADVAHEVAQKTKFDIRKNVTTLMLKKANDRPKALMKLIG